MIYTVTLNPNVDHTLTVPAIQYNQVLRSSQVYRDCGGKGFNVSRALQILGVPSVAMGWVGGDSGHWEEQHLRALGIETDFDVISGDTRTCVVVIEQESGKYIKVNEPGPTISAQEQENLINHISRMAKPADYWVFSGSLPPGLPPDSYQNMIKLVQSQGARACLDASKEPFAMGLKACPYLIKPNQNEAEDILGKSISTEKDFCDAAAYFLDLGVSIAAISLGSQGLLLASRAGAVRVKPPEMIAINPVGNGDALLAGVLFALERGMELRDLARWGVACGSVTASQEGVNFGSKDAVIEMLNRVEVL